MPKSAVMAVADREGAIPFDAPGATLNHEGDLCTFDVIIRNYGLADRALAAAGPNRQCRGHRPVRPRPSGPRPRGHRRRLHLRYPDDMQNIERQFEVYDALYAWCRLETAKEKLLN